MNVARVGLYPESIAADVSPDRLKRYFVKEESGRYRVKKLIRETLIFAPQNVIKDPPFTKLDLLSCRNLLIYLGPELQKKLLPVFHYSLKPDGTAFSRYLRDGRSVPMTSFPAGIEEVEDFQPKTFVFIGPAVREPARGFVQWRYSHGGRNGVASDTG